MTSNPRLVAALSILAIFAAVVLLHEGRSVLIPLVLSVLASYALEPVVARLQRWAVPRLLATTIVMLALAGVIAGGVYGLGYQAAALVDELPRAARTVREQIRSSRIPGGTLEKLDQARTEIERASEDLASGAASANPPPPPRTHAAVPMLDVVWWGSAGLLVLAGHATVMFFLTFFLLLSGDLFKRKLLKLAGPTLARRRVTLDVLDEIDSEIKRYLFVRLLTSIVVAVATWAALKWIGLENPAIWGIAAGVCNVIPYLGPVLISGGIAVVGLIQFGDVATAALAAGLALLVTALEGWLLDPPLMGKIERLNAVAVLVGLSFWTAVWGGWGALLAVPMLSVTKTICDRIDGFRPIGELLGD